LPCYRCGVRQADPERGESPWRRGVLRDHLVLVCPACQAAPDWSAELQRCERCASVHLIRRLDQVECLDCGLVRSPAAAGTLSIPGTSGTAATSGTPGSGASSGSGATSGPGGDPTLAAVVARALERVLGRRLGP